ncbi:MAG: type III-A CRISPR-associated protein Cas10/Csm1 [Cyclobacteriaceae bacterium]
MTSSKKYLLKGDISGIQDFIFNVSSKGAAKSLKARSYYVQMVQILGCRLLKEELNKKVGVDNYKLIYSGGGSFYYRISEVSDIQGFVEVCQKRIDHDLKYDDIYLSLSYVEVSGGQPFGEGWENLRVKSNQHKLMAFQNSFEGLFKPFDFHSYKEGQDKIRWVALVKKINERLSNQMMMTVTDEMAKSKNIETSLFGLNERKEFDLDEITSELPIWGEDAESNFPELVAKLSNDNAPDHQKPKKGFIIDFDYLAGFAELRTGTNKIGILKMDVDSLGQHFKGKDNENELIVLSEGLSGFFREKVLDIWKSKVHVFNKEVDFNENIYTVFTGGDDCFFIGAWDAILLFAREVNKAFTASSFAADKNLTLSAGIVLVAPTFPVVRFAELAESAIYLAKGKEGKNAISIFNEIFSWKEFDNIIELTSTLRELIVEKEESRALLERIKRSAVGYGALENLALQNVMHYPKVWRLKYYLRNAKNEGNRKEIDEKIFSKYSDALIAAFMEKEKTNVMMYPTAARITEFLTRKRPNNYEPE